VNHSDVVPIEGSCSAIGLHLLIEPVTRPLASWNVVTPLRSVRAVPVTRPARSWKVVTPLASVLALRVTRPAAPSRLARSRRSAKRSCPSAS
jgi:hypothetical protein